VPDGFVGILLVLVLENRYQQRTGEAMLTDTKVRALKKKEAPYKVSDSAGLYIQVQPNGSRLWRMAYRFRGKQRTAAFGMYPDISLSVARLRRDEVKRQLRSGDDPSVVVKAEKAAVVLAASRTFRAVGDDWFQKKMVDEEKSEKTIRRAKWILDILNEGIGDRQINEIEAPELLVVLRRLEAQEKYETVKRARSTASIIFRFGIATGVCKRDPAADLKGALTSVASTPHAAITDPTGVGKLLRAIDGYDTKPLLRFALQLLALTFTRPGNVAAAEWSEFDVDAGVWSISAEKMKMREAFRIPLSRQALALLAELRKITGGSKYLFPSFRTGKRPMFVNLLNVALRDIGYAADEMQAHGFRSTASTILNERSEFSPDVIELSLAHRLGGVRAIYNRAEYWGERCLLVQWYADHLDGLRKVVAMPQRKRTAMAETQRG
jgi:integrase